MSSSGELIAQIYTSKAQIPISDATVAIIQPKDGGTYHLVAMRYTDFNGKTSPIELPTPSPLQSTMPEGDDPFTSYDILLYKMGFEMQQIQDIQLFPEAITIQKSELIPLPEYTPLRSRVEVSVIPLQDL